MSEAAPVLYGRNIFFGESGRIFAESINQIRPDSLSYLRKIEITINIEPCPGDNEAWFKVLDLLACGAKSLRIIKIHWGCNVIAPPNGKGERKPRGLYLDVEFARVVARNLKNVKEIILSGFYGKRWPE